MTFESKFLGLPILAWIPLLPLIGAFLNLTIGRRLSRGAVHTIAIAAVAASCGLAFYLVFFELFDLYKHGNPDQTFLEQNVYTWIDSGQFKIPLAFRLDTLSAVMILIVTFVGSLIHIYSTGYMAHEPRYAAYFGYLNLFTGAMLILVLAANMPVMFIGWEGVGLCSFLLIGFWYEREDYANAGRKAFVVNRIGDFCFLLGMFLLFWATKDLGYSGDHGSLDFQNLGKQFADANGKIYISEMWGGDRLAAAAGIFLFIGACGKSAQLPLYVWLPDAMAGPTPVSALIHAATMVTAGVYMVVRLSFLYSASPPGLAVAATVGLLTALAAAFMAFAQTDLKKVLAYSTVSQLGFMFVAAGTGNWTAAIFHLGTHAFFKACLFLGAGSVMHAMEHAGSHTPGDIMTMGGLGKRMKVTRLTFMVSCLAIAGIFPFAGFFSKDEILGGAWSVSPPGWPSFYGELLWAGLLVGALGTAFYMWRLYFLVFSGEPRSDAARYAHDSPASMTGPLVVLAVLASVAGFIGLPHFKGIKLPAFMHALDSWLSRSTTPVFYDVGGKACNLGAPSPDEVCGHGFACLNKTGCFPEIHGHVADSTTFILMGVALAVALAGIGLAWMFYAKGPTPTVEKLVAGPLQPAYEASKHKLWVDEIYDAAIVRPFRWLARGLFEIVDRFIIDLIAVTGVAFVVSLFGRVSRWFQNGQVQRYLAGLVVGAAAVFLVTDCKSKATFDVARIGDTYELRANLGAGVIGQKAEIKWDVNGDGKVSLVDDRGNPADVDVDGKLLEGPVVRVHVGNVGQEITMIVEDPITRKVERYRERLGERIDAARPADRAQPRPEAK